MVIAGNRCPVAPKSNSLLRWLDEAEDGTGGAAGLGVEDEDEEEGLLVVDAEIELVGEGAAVLVVAGREILFLA